MNSAFCNGNGASRAARRQYAGRAGDGIGPAKIMLQKLEPPHQVGEIFIGFNAYENAIIEMSRKPASDCTDAAGRELLRRY